MKLSFEKKYILFSSTLERHAKNYPLAKTATEYVGDVELVELIGYDRNKVAFLQNAWDLLFMTSFYEGSPQIINEAMACNCPIVSTDVGTVTDLIKDTKGCYITLYDPIDISDKIKGILDNDERTKGRKKVSNQSLDIVAV